MRAHGRRRYQANPRSLEMTSMMGAFIRALARWTERNADADTPVVIPTGVVDAAELAKVITAIITLQQGQAS